MRINNNIMAMNAHRQLGVNSVNQSKSIEKLSSGLRINRAGDDAAGLAISEKMRSQVRGLNQASRNAQDDISLIQTAEGALNETHDILHRMRVMAVQSANDSNTDDDRSALQAEMNQLRDEVDRISTQTEFNTRKILTLDPTAKSGAPAEGVKRAIEDKVPGWLNDAMKALTERLGIDPMTKKSNGDKRKLKVEFVDDPSSSAVMSMGGFDTKDTDLMLRINLDKVLDDKGNPKPDDEFDRVLAHEMLHGYQFTNMRQIMFTPNRTKAENMFIEGMAEISGGYANGRVAGEIGGNYAAISGANLVQGNLDATKGTYQLNSKDYAAGFLAMKVLHESTTVGITAIINRLEAGDSIDQAIANTTQGKIGELKAGEPGAANFGEGANTDGEYTTFKAVLEDIKAGAFDKFFQTTDDIKVNVGSGAIVDGATAGSHDNLSAADAIPNNTGTALADAVFDFEFESDNQTPTGGTGGTTGVQQTELVFHIGANTNQNMKYDIVDMGSRSLGINRVRITSQESANKAIETFDKALKMVSDERARLGAIQNRLEHTIKNVDTSAENLQASESRIRDVDMAKEMMTYTKNNILSQAAQSMLAQANQAPQGVLQLLR